jgi:hypothetical protein
MIYGKNTALGIDISGGRIAMALLRRTNGQFYLLKSASRPLPDGLIKCGNIEKPSELAAAIQQTKRKAKIHASQAAISLVSQPLLTQILEIPSQQPDQVEEFIGQKLKQYAILPVKSVAMDYCRLNPAGKRQGLPKALVVATDGSRLEESSSQLNRIGRSLCIDAIEPAFLAYIRAGYASRASSAGETNMVLVIAGLSALTLCLFTAGHLEFVRTKRPEPGQCGTCSLANEDECAWQVTVAGEGSDGVMTERLREGISGLERVQLEVGDQNEIDPEIVVGMEKAAEKPSATAVGLAIKLLESDDTAIGVNLLPPEIGKARLRRKKSWTIATAAAAVFFFMAMGSGVLEKKAMSINSSIDPRQRQLYASMSMLLQERTQLSSNIELLEAFLKNAESSISAEPLVKWAGILDDIANATPEAVRITRMTHQNDTDLLIDTQSVNYEGVRLFVQSLGKSPRIENAALVGTHSQAGPSGLPRYSIKCRLSGQQGKQ